MKTNLIQIGNSKGIRIPKSLIEQFNLTEGIELIPSAQGLLIASTVKPRKSWEDSFKKAVVSKNSAENSEWQNISNGFDKEEWSW